MSARDKAISSTLGYALLGLLAREERSGYDLTQALKNPVGYFWFAQHSQVYPELARLETAGLVAHTLIEQADRPDKKVYRLTDMGRAALSAWLNADTELPRKRDELVLKAYSIWLADPAAAARMMREHAQTHAAHLAEFQSGLSNLEGEAGAALWQPDSPWFGVHAVLRRGIGYEREYSEWCEWLAQCLEGTEKGSP
ncbi:PadR family transcriptional regulator [Deinococcus marmoris]|uniref:Transcriptional regulator, PadR family n=1 Tax=Deinococcus marmoris TaxID=249408 RepID=A0A1U7NRJ5_9DEIO|nr:PadR family transcriptional regulator [Deinococcus marmoris]OLV15541.1 Transcriptional regulator, PadR family [Deinococcus marmoris]